MKHPIEAEQSASSVAVMVATARDAARTRARGVKMRSKLTQFENGNNKRKGT
jgi:hypothetical protein